MTKSAADIKEKESKKSEAKSQLSGAKKMARTVNNLISPAPIPTRKISGVRSRTNNPVRGCTSV
jgi:hypothetical protein